MSRRERWATYEKVRAEIRTRQTDRAIAARNQKKSTADARSAPAVPENYAATVVKCGVLSSRRCRQRAADRQKRLVGGLADEADGREANDDDQRQHHGILDGSGTVFFSEEVNS